MENKKYIDLQGLSYYTEIVKQLIEERVNENDSITEEEILAILNGIDISSPEVQDAISALSARVKALEDGTTLNISYASSNQIDNIFD